MDLYIFLKVFIEYYPRWHVQKIIEFNLYLFVLTIGIFIIIKLMQLRNCRGLEEFKQVNSNCKMSHVKNSRFME